MKPKKHDLVRPLQGIDSRVFLGDFYETSAEEMSEKINGRATFETPAYIYCADGKRLYLTGAHVRDDYQINPERYERPKGLDL